MGLVDTTTDTLVSPLGDDAGGGAAKASGWTGGEGLAAGAGLAPEAAASDSCWRFSSSISRM